MTPYQLNHVYAYLIYTVICCAVAITAAYVYRKTRK